MNKASIVQAVMCEGSWEEEIGHIHETGIQWLPKSQTEN
jgi:hypothetical protein